ncbi:MAG: DUF4339 domain-containing protein [Verrucomicrobiota bacterium]
MSAENDSKAPLPEATESEELQFFILKQGASEPGGPYLEDHLLGMLNDGSVTENDYVFFEGMPDWRPIKDVFEMHEQINHFIDDGQDKYKVGEAFDEVSKVLAPGEEIYYVAVQEKAGLLSKAKQCVIVTDGHVYHLTEIRAGFELEAHPWGQVTNTLMRDEGSELATFSILLDKDRRVDISHLPLAQVQRLFQLSQELGKK